MQQPYSYVILINKNLLWFAAKVTSDKNGRTQNKEFKKLNSIYGTFMLSMAINSNNEWQNYAFGKYVGCK